MSKCNVPPPGWYCTRESGHPGPCAAIPIEPELGPVTRYMKAEAWVEELEADNERLFKLCCQLVSQRDTLREENETATNRLAELEDRVEDLDGVVRAMNRVVEFA